MKLYEIPGQIIAISITATAASIGAAGIPQVKDNDRNQFKNRR